VVTDIIKQRQICGDAKLI